MKPSLCWEDVHLPAEGAVGTVRIDWTLVRIKGEGLVRTDPKTPAYERTLPLPSRAVTMLRERRRVAFAEGRISASPVFPDSLGGLRGPSNTRRSLRDARGSAGFPGDGSQTAHGGIGLLM